MPFLNEEKHQIGCCAFNSRLLYAFGGAKKKRFVDTVERYDTFHNEGWQIIQPTAVEGWSERTNLGCAQIDQQSILVFGGVVNDLEGWKKDFSFSLLYNVKLNVFESTPSDMIHPEREFFNCGPPRLQDSKFYAIDSEEQVNIFDSLTKTWSFALGKEEED